jgi:hypothetical protein
VVEGDRSVAHGPTLDHPIRTPNSGNRDGSLRAARAEALDRSDDLGRAVALLSEERPMGDPRPTP